MAELAAGTGIDLTLSGIQGGINRWRAAKELQPAAEIVGEQYILLAKRLEHAPADNAKVQVLNQRQEDEVKGLWVYLGMLQGYTDFGRFVRLRSIKKRIDDYAKTVIDMNKELDVVMEGLTDKKLTVLQVTAEETGAKVKDIQDKQDVTIELMCRLEIKFDTIIEQQGAKFLKRGVMLEEMESATFSESMTLLKYELDEKQDENSPEHAHVMSVVYHSVFKLKEFQAPEYSAWFLSPNDVTIDDNEPLPRNESVQICRGSYDGMTVDVKRMKIDGDLEAKNMFRRELEKLVKVQHENVVRFFGACDAESPAFIVYECASQGDFIQYFDVNGKAQFWRLFYQAALGLRHLHRRKIIHGDLKCANLLVGKDGLAKVSGLGFSYAADLSAGRSANPPPDESSRWKAPERFETTRDTASRSASDLYSFGICLWEAAQDGELPYGVEADDMIIKLKLDGVVPDRPNGLKDDEWEFLQLLLARDWKMRPTIDQVVEMLDGFAKREAKEEVKEEVHSNCTTDGSAAPRQYRICKACGHKVQVGVSGAVELVPPTINEGKAITMAAA